MVERDDKARAARLTHNLRALRIVGAYHRIVIEEVEARFRQGTRAHLETIVSECAWRRCLNSSGVVHWHVPCFQIDTLPVSVTAILITAREYLPVAIKRVLYRRCQVVE